MIPNLPRPLLWTEKTSMEEFFEDDPLNVWFHDCYEELPIILTSHLDELKFFNEVYYQLTRICYEHPTPDDYPRYAKSIEEDLVWLFSVELAMSMIYFYARERHLSSMPNMDHFLRFIWRRHSNDDFWGCFSRYRKVPEAYQNRDPRTLRKEGPDTPYPVKPCPWEPEALIEARVDWSVITKDYNPAMIEDVLSLWEREDHKQVIRTYIDTDGNKEAKLLLGRLMGERLERRKLEEKLAELEQEKRVMEQEKRLLEEKLENADDSIKEKSYAVFAPAIELLKEMIGDYRSTNNWIHILRPYRAAIEAKALPLWSKDEFHKNVGIKVPSSSYSKYARGNKCYTREELEVLADQFRELIV